MKTIQQILALLTLIAWLTACGPGPTLPAATLPPADPATGASPEPASPQPDANPTLVSGSLWLNLVAPQDQAVVNVAQIELVGQAPPDTVITVNDQILIVGPEGQFTTAVSLVEGPNVIEIVASDADGNEIDTNLTVIYQP